MKTAAEQAKAIEALEPKVERLKSLYQQYFMGIEKVPPAILKRDIDRAIYQLRKVRLQNTAMRFKFQAIIQRLNTYQQYWQRIMRQIENGTYKRDIQRAAAKFGKDDVLRATGRGAEAALRDVDDEPSVPVWEIDVDDFDDDDGHGAGGQSVWTVPQEAYANKLPDPTGGEAPAGARPRGMDPYGTVDPYANSAGDPYAHSAGAQPAGAQNAYARQQYEQQQRQYERELAAYHEKVRVYEEKKRAYEAYQRQQAAERAAQAQTPQAQPPLRQVPQPKPSAPGSLPERPAAPAQEPPKQRKPRRRGGALPGTKRAGEPDDKAARSVYAKYVQARRQAGESTASITYEKLKRSLDTQRKNLRKKHGDRNVDFEVVTKNGRTMIRPVIK